MHLLRHRRPARSRRWWPRRTARLRFTAAHSGLFLVSGGALVAITYLLFQRATVFPQPPLPQVPHPPEIQQVQLPTVVSLVPRATPQLPAALSALALDQQRLAYDQTELSESLPPQGQGPPTLGPGPRQQLASSVHELAQDQQQLAQGQQQLTTAVGQLAQAVHQLSQAGTVEAAQRASDSHQLLVNSVTALAIVAMLAVLAAWLLAGRMLRPLRTITSTARRISSASLHERLGLRGADEEFIQLGDTLDDLFARLEAAFEAQRHFVANASHELRTPITRERALVQVALGDPATPEVWRRTGEELLASNREQEHLIEALLTLACSEGGVEHREPLDLAVIAAAVLRDSRNGTERLALDVDATIAPAHLDGDPRLVERLVANLVDNALTHNIAAGEVHLATGTRDGQAFLTVTNTGPVVPAPELDRLFQPFQRLDPHRVRRRKGHGLGLSIVNAIATAHGATVAAHAPPEGGVTIDVVFPPAQPTGAACALSARSGPAASGAPGHRHRPLGPGQRARDRQ